MFFRDGKSRQFGFVGFRTEKESEEALKFFNNSFMDTCRITCEVCDLPFLLPLIVTKTLVAALVILKKIKLNQWRGSVLVMYFLNL